MITKYYEVVCDYCGCAIGHFNVSSVSDAVDEAREDGAKIVGSKQFCDDDCYSRKQKDSKKKK